LVLAGFIAGLGALFACSSEDDAPSPFTPTGGTYDGSSGAGTSAGAPSGGASGAGVPGIGGSSATAGSTGSGGALSGAGGTAGGSTAGSGMVGGTGGGGAGSDLTKVWRSEGCGKAFTGTPGQVQTIQTAGTKATDCAAHLAGQPRCGEWSVTREYTVFLPKDYDANRAYTLLFEGPGCGGSSVDVYPIQSKYQDATTNNADATIIRVGLRPPPNSVGHGTNENQGCFDDKEGDDSVDWVFYENLYDELNGELCFDRNRVFSAGNSSGSWFSNELGCKYAGDAERPVRGVLPNTGGLPTEPQYVPTCTSAPMAGMWVHEINDSTNSFAGNKVAIARAMKNNGCAQSSFDAAELESYDIGNGSALCQRIKNCDPLYPLVVCPLNGNGHGSHDETTNPGFSTFLKSFQKAPLLTE
jgi:polyhydroxybutyrate depolymerase